MGCLGRLLRYHSRRSRRAHPAAAVRRAGSGQNTARRAAPSFLNTARQKQSKPQQEQIGGPCTEMLGDCIHARFDMEKNGDRFESLGFHETSS